MDREARDDLEHTRRVQDCLFQVFDILALPMSLTEQLERIHRALFDVLDASNLYVGVYDEETGLYLFPYNADEDDDDFAPQRLDGSLTDYVRQTREPLLCDLATHERLASEGVVTTIGTPSPAWMAAPLTTGNGTFGVVVVQSYVDPDAYVPRDLDTLTLVARAMAHAVEGAYRRQTLEADHRLRLQALELSRDEAVAANKAKSTFLATMSHELRTPLTAILGYTELLEEELTAAGYDARDELGHIRSSSNHLVRVISDILDLSRIESNQLQPVIDAVTLSEVVEKAQTLTAPLLEAHGATLAVRTTDAALSTDAGKLTQIVTNLLANAAIHGGEQITLRAVVREEKAERVLCIEVSDNGAGLSSEDLPRLFRAFEQGDGSSTRRSGGSGLGLAICRGFARLLGGDCTAASVPGMGSTFTVRLPV